MLHNKTIKKILSPLSVFVISFFAVAGQVKADLINPITKQLGGNDGVNTTDATEGKVFIEYFLMLWNAALTIGALLVLLYFVWGAVEWITSAGDNSKLQAARNKILHAFIGLLLLVSAYTIIGFTSNLLFGSNFDILSPQFITPS